MTWLILEAAELDPGSTYEARLRVQMANLEDVMAEEERYEGPWSEWSQPVSFLSPQRQGGRSGLLSFGSPIGPPLPPFYSWDRP